MPVGAVEEPMTEAKTLGKRQGDMPTVAPVALVAVAVAHAPATVDRLQPTQAAAAVVQAMAD